MQQADFIRHGNADYFEDSLTYIGLKQVNNLVGNLEKRLPENILYGLISSPSGRALQTAHPISLVLTRKAGKEVKIIEEPCLGQIASMGNDKTILENGKYNAGLIEKYKGLDYGVFDAHDKIIVATSIEIADEYEIPIPEFLKIKEYDEKLVTWAMNKFKLEEKEAIEKVKQYSLFVPELPFITEASAVHIDFEKKEIEYFLLRE